ncbi:MAG: hypothetical protein ACOH2R_08525 [Pseudomonas sp.]
MSKVAVQETQEQIDARIAQELLDSGDHHDPIDDDLIVDVGGAASAAAAKAPPNADIDLDTLAAIVGEDVKPKMVPHSRFNEVNEESKLHRARVLELEELLARANGKAAAPAAKDEPKAVAYDYDAAEELYSAAILDGDTAKAKIVRAEIRANERAEHVREAEEAADRRYKANRQTDDLARATAERDLAVAKAYVEFPFLDSASADANQDAIDEVLALTNHFTSKGKTIGDALATAVSRVGPRYAPAVSTEKKLPVEVKADLQAGLDRAAKIPPKATGLGARANTVDVRKLTGADIKKLSKEEDALLSGNEV